jgi:hypothetical protein
VIISSVFPSLQELGAWHDPITPKYPYHDATLPSYLPLIIRNWILSGATKPNNISTPLQLTSLSRNVDTNLDSIYSFWILEVAKRCFTIDLGEQSIPVEGHNHKNVALKYLMKRRRSLLMTKDPLKVDRLYSDLPKSIRVMGKQLTRSFIVNWEKEGINEFKGSRFVFVLEEQ